MRPSLRSPPPPESSARTQRILPCADLVGEPGDADLALAAGEAAEAGDVRVGGDDRRRRGGLAGDGERAAAVGLDVGERGGERGGVAAEHAAAARPAEAAAARCRRAGRRAGAGACRRGLCRRRAPVPAAPGRCRPVGAGAAGCRRPGRRAAAGGGAARRPPPKPPRPPPPGPPKPPPAFAGPPAGNVPEVAWPSVWTDQVAGAIRSVGERRSRAGVAGPRVRAERERARRDARRPRRARRQPRQRARVVGEHHQLGDHAAGDRQRAGDPGEQVAAREAHGARADERGGERGAARSRSRDGRCPWRC